MEDAVEQLRERLPTGASLTVNAFALHAALERAGAILEKKT